jgi:hypothetical protein
MLHVIILTLVTLIATALPSAADIYKYRDANGKLVISNQPPPAGAEVESQHNAMPPSMAPAGSNLASPSDAQLPRASAPKRLPSYVDLNPLELQGTGVESSEVYWKKFVTGRVKNRSGVTTASNVMVRTACTLGGRPTDTGSAYLGTIGPRGQASFQIPIILDVQPYYRKGRGWFTPQIGAVRCDTEVTYDKL